MISSAFNTIVMFCYTVFHFVIVNSLYASGLLIIVGLLSHLWRKKSAYWQYYLWMLIAVRLVLPPNLSTQVSVFNVFDRLSSNRTPTHTINRISEILTANTPSDGGAVPATPFDWRRLATARRQSEYLNNSHKSDPYASLPGMIFLMPWLFGCICFLLLYLHKMAGFYRLTRMSDLIDDKEVVSIANEWRRELNISRKVRIITSNMFNTPFTLGVFQPVIYVPLHIIRMRDMDVISAVIAHEMAHVKRLDDLWIKMQSFILIAFFFHPAAWYAFLRVSAARERICDSVVLTSRKILPKSYGASMVALLTQQFPDPAVKAMVSGFVDYKSNIKQRIKDIVKEDAMKKNNPLIPFVMIACIGILVLPMAPAKLKADEKQFTNKIDDIFRPLEGWFAATYDPEVLQIRKSPSGAQWNKLNPNIKGDVGQLNSYGASIENAQKPGIAYLLNDAPVRAVAPGIVHFVGHRSAGNKNGGLYVRIYHDIYDGLKKEMYPRITLYRKQAYRSTYYHLSEVKVKQWQAVQRGQVIGYAKSNASDGKAVVKLVFEERGTFVNPDDYGIDHGFMKYRGTGEPLNLDLKTINLRLDKQNELVEELFSYYANKAMDNVYTKIHTVVETEKYKAYAVRWSALDRFRYLSELYKKNPVAFSGLTMERFKDLTQKFYIHQPIYLSLPFSEPAQS